MTPDVLTPQQAIAGLFAAAYLVAIGIVMWRDARKPPVPDAEPLPHDRIAAWELRMGAHRAEQRRREAAIAQAEDRAESRRVLANRLRFERALRFVQPDQEQPQ